MKMKMKMKKESMNKMPLKNQDEYNEYMRNYMRFGRKIRPSMRSREEILEKLVDLLSKKEVVSEIVLLKWVLKIEDNQDD